MELVPSAGKNATDEQRGKTWNWFQAREKMQPMKSAGNYVELVPSAGKTATGEQRGKTWIWLLTRDIMQSMKTAGKRVTLLIGLLQQLVT